MGPGCGSEYISRMPALIDTPEAANRLARAIASDLSLYNEAKIKEGIENDTFFSVLQDEIAEGRAHYQSRVDPKLLGSSNFYDRALVDVILARKGHIKSKIW
jgi:hypothetical protein